MVTSQSRRVHSVTTNETVVLSDDYSTQMDVSALTIRYMNGERRLPPFAEDALAVLDEAVGDADDGLPKDEAEAVLVADDRFDTVDAEYALDVLQNRGYIYYVDEQVYITPTDD